ncbi:MAG: hypothetical protein ACTHZI_01490 [Luteimonas sp.]
MKSSLAVLSFVALIAGCSSKTDPNEKNFGAAIDAYLAKKGALCLNAETWPVELNESQRKMAESLGGTGRAARLEALLSRGLVASETMDKPELSLLGQQTGRVSKVTRYELTDEGRRFFRESRSRGGFSKPNEGEVRGELCYGNKALDKVVKWEGPMKLGDYQGADVKYLYKIEDLAEWAQSDDIQNAFPVVKESISGAGSKLQSHGVQLTNLGWEANGIDRE